MLVKIKNLTSGPVSLPGPFPRLLNNEEVSVDTTPDALDYYRDALSQLQIIGAIRMVMVRSSTMTKRLLQVVVLMV